VFLLLHRALRNAGDFLIFERARALISDGHPDVEQLVGKAWLPLADQFPLERVNACRAVIVCGGPGYGRGMRRLYPLASADELRVPVVLLALGSAVVPGTERQLAAHRFEPEDRDFLTWISERSAYLGARDALTAELLARAGFGGVLMTGDPAWYDLAAITSEPTVPQGIESLAFTPPANPVYFAQALGLLRGLVRARAGRLVTVVFHRGEQAPFAQLAAELGCATRDITGSAAGFSVYDEVDGHVGYRVHAHLYALSRGRQSYLVAEDSRGTGVLRTLGPLGVPGFRERAGDSPPMRLALRVMPRLGNPGRPITRRLGPALSRLLPVPDVADALLAQIDADAGAGFARHAAAQQIIRATLPTMRRMVASLP
jgi:hypothetical protein